MMQKVAVLMSFLLMVILPVSLPAQEEEDLGALSLQSRRMLEEGRDLYESAEFARAIQALDRVLADFDTWVPGTLPEEEEEVRIEAYRLRGLAYYNLGEAASARADFTVMLRQQPDYQLDRTLLSPKIIDAFEDVRSQVTGMLVVNSDPPGAEVRLGGRALGVTPLEPVRVAVGRYLLDLEKRGFSLVHESVEVVAGESTTLEYPLHRNARGVTVMTMPTGAGITVDGVALGITGGSPPPGYEILLMEDGLNPADVSAPFTMPFLAAGRHVIRVEKECYATMEADFQVTLDGGELPLELETIVLSPSRSGLSIRSTPAGAGVRLDGRHVGSTPLELDELCGQEVLVQLELSQVGAWEDAIQLRPGERLAIDAELKLSLASLGVVREIGVDNPSLAGWDEFLHQVVAEQDAYLSRFPEVSVDGISSAHLELFRQIQAAGDGIPSLDVDLRRRLRQEIGADLFLVAKSAGSRRGTVYLFGMHRSSPDLLSLNREGQGDGKSLIDLLNRASLDSRSWSGLLTVETGESDFPYVVRQSPSASEGTTLLPGDRVRSVDGRPVTSRLELEAEFAGREPGSRVPVSIQRGEAMVTAVVVTAETPVFSRPGGKGVLINKTIADLERTRLMATDERQQNLAALGLGIAYLMGGDPARAMTEGFERCRLPAGAGISSGTLDYLKGVSLEALGSGRAVEATSAFERAAEQTEATLWKDDGPLVAPLATARTANSGR